MEVNMPDIQESEKALTATLEEYFYELKVEREIETGDRWEQYLPAVPGTLTEFSESWEDTQNLDARIIEIQDQLVKLEVLVDRESRQFEDRFFRKQLLEGAVTLEVGTYVLLRIFRGRGKIKFTFHNGDSIVDRELFEDTSRFSDLDDFDFDVELE